MAESKTDINEAVKNALLEQLRDLRAASQYENCEGLPGLTLALCEVVDRLKEF